MTQLTHSQELSGSVTRKNGQILAAAMLGFLILSIVGLAPVEVIHNATHDVRHSSGFPCH
ncbi:MAG: CbtB-domain containing protein [Methylococcales bacterium]|nr:CbtB-domain containing protein [Methylococcales bacterium]